MQENDGSEEDFPPLPPPRERVISILAKFERDLGFTAPELFPMRMRQLREALLEVVDPSDAEPEPGHRLVPFPVPEEQ